MKIKEQTRKLAGAAQNTVLRLQIELTKQLKHCFEVVDGLTKSVTIHHGKATLTWKLTWFEEIFED
ncbi:hypothetical protein [Streptococcus pneumoniae]|uniref:hypothetical protein n=1 Tax=Streptococcus pneumoniae TaxID=1313 RepID=UPI0005E64D69|nr:hypothetical protein [Streptococcus pneumoniae]CFP87317.1 chlorohydrolase [Streptococcus pneumoniae]